MADIIDFRPRNENGIGGCGFLSSRELDLWIEGRLGREREAQFAGHREQGCSACALLAADLEVFRNAERTVATAGERREFESLRGPVLERSVEALPAAPRTTDAPRARRHGWLAVAGMAAAAVLAVAVLVPRSSGPGRLPLPRGGSYDVRPLPFSAPPVVRDARALADLWKEAGEAHRTGDYARSARLFERIERSSPDSHDAMLYRGEALVMLGRYDEAVGVLERARETAEREGFPTGGDDYYLGLASIGIGDLERARRVLDRASRSGGPYAGEAREVLLRLDAE